MNQDFWDLIKKGNESAFSQLYNQYSDMLYGYGMKIIYNDDLVTECIQKLFVYIFEKRAGLSRPESIKAYLCSSLKRILIREYGRNNSYKICSLEDLDEKRYDFKLSLDIESTLIKGEHEKVYLQQLQSALDSLSPRQREVIFLKYYKSCSNDEVSEILGLDNQIIRNLAYQAIKRMKEIANFKGDFVSSLL